MGSYQWCSGNIRRAIGYRNGSNDRSIARAASAHALTPAHHNCQITQMLIGAALLTSTIKYYSHFTIMPDKLILTYKFRVFSYKNSRRRQLFLNRNIINNALLVLFFGFNCVQSVIVRDSISTKRLKCSKLVRRRAAFNIHRVQGTFIN